MFCDTCNQFVFGTFPSPNEAFRSHWFGHAPPAIPPLPLMIFHHHDQQFKFNILCALFVHVFNESCIIKRVLYFFTVKAISKS